MMHSIEYVRLEGWFEIPAELSQLTRHSYRCYMIIKLKFNTNNRKYFFNVIVCDQWNGLSNCVKASNLTKFQIVYDAYLLSSVTFINPIMAKGSFKTHDSHGVYIMGQKVPCITI